MTDHAQTVILSLDNGFRKSMMTSCHTDLNTTYWVRWWQYSYDVHGAICGYEYVFWCNDCISRYYAAKSAAEQVAPVTLCSNL